MQYMLLIYGDEACWTEQEREVCMLESMAVCDELAVQGKYIASSPLYPVASATSLRVRNGKRQITHGPFPDSTVGALHRAPGDYPSGTEGQVLTVEFTLLGIACIGLNGGPAFMHNESFSFQVATEDQDETDRYWHAIVSNGGQESECGWCKDKWGISWQITPIALTKAYTSPDRIAAKRAFNAMMTMRKIDIAAIEAAFRG